MENTSMQGIDYLTTGQMADFNLVSKKTLRVYYEKELLVPEHIDENTGYRYYTLDQCAELDFIQQMKALGFSLEEIKHIQGQNDPQLLTSLVDEKLVDIENELSRLMVTKKAGESLVSDHKRIRAQEKWNEVYYEEFPERRILKICPIESHLISHDSKQVYARWEEVLKRCKKTILEKSYPLMLFRNISYTIAEESLPTDNPYYKDTIVFVDNNFEDTRDETDIIPGGLFVVQFCNTTTDDEGGFLEEKILREMVDDLQEKGFSIAGDFIGEVIADTPIFCGPRQNLIVRVQIPVKK